MCAASHTGYEGRPGAGLIRHNEGNFSSIHATIGNNVPNRSGLIPENTMRIATFALLATIGLAGCASEPIDREGRLLTLAAQEAQQNSDPTERLTRQLNFAYRQLEHGKFTESRQSLAYAAQTLRDAKPDALKPQIRIAGWVSISELSRQNKDLPTAQTACDQAVTTLTSLPTVSQRPDFVIGVSSEVEALQGKPAAAKLLEQSAPWIKEIHGVPMRRAALVAISDAIFNCDDFDGGLALLRTDTDATWRSDALSMLADRDARDLDWISNVGNAAVPGTMAPAPPITELATTNPADTESRFQTVSRSFGKPVDFHSVFQQFQSASQQQQSK